MSNTLPLPPSERQLNVEALSRIFADTTNSYKILFFRAVLSIISSGKVGATKRIPLSDITAKMLVSGWIIGVYYRLSFGSGDQLLSMLSQLSVGAGGRNLTSPNHGNELEDKFREYLGSVECWDIHRYVPYRLLRPFFPKLPRGMPDWRVNRWIQEQAEASSLTQQPAPYVIVNQSSIELNEYWYAYFDRHLKILTDWVDWHLASYLQRRNPNAPSITSKLYLPKSRRPLQWQRRLWISMLSQAQVRCIYSNEKIRLEGFHLDHYLPWSFVCHDEGWNLIPVAPAVNSSKSNTLPSSRYLSAFIDLQAHALAVARHHLSGSDWDKVCSSYSAGLRIVSEDFGRPDVLRRSFEETILPLASIAKRMGFVSDWEFSASER
jgi:hypothetical protein